MSARLIRISSRATGERRHVRVYVYDTREEMWAAAKRFNGCEGEGANGFTQAYERWRIEPDGTDHLVAHLIIIRLCREHLGSGTITHEVNHAAVAIYGSTLDLTVKARDVLDNANETLAYLQSDLTVALVNRLYALGYYGKE